MESPKFVGWAAVSTGAQARDEKISLTEQLYANLEACRRHNGVMVRQLIVPGESRSIVKFGTAAETVLGFRMVETFDNLENESMLREIERNVRDLQESGERIAVYAELDRLIESKAFDVLAFRNLGRIGRNAALSITVMNMCHEVGIVGYSTAAPPQSLEDAGDNYHRSLLDAITAVGYENEVREIKRRHETGMIRRIEGGRFPGKIPYGYKAIRNGAGKITDYEIVEEEANVIRRIISLYLDEQLGTPNIAEWLYANGIPSPSGKARWAKNSVLVLLQRAEQYAGTNKLNQRSKKRKLIKAPGRWPPIISEETAQRIKKEFKAREQFGRSAHHIHRYSRMVFCVCGKRCRVQNTMMRRTRADGSLWQKRLTRYQCNNHGGIAEWKITEAIQAFIENLKTADFEDVLEQPQDTNATDAIIADIERIQTQIDTTKAGIDRADSDYYVIGAIDEERHRSITKAANDRVAHLMAELTRLREQLAEEEQAELTVERLQEIIDNGERMLALPDARKANAWLRYRIRVTIDGSKIVKIGTA